MAALCTSTTVRCCCRLPISIPVSVWHQCRSCYEITHTAKARVQGRQVAARSGQASSCSILFVLMLLSWGYSPGMILVAASGTGSILTAPSATFDNQLCNFSYYNHQMKHAPTKHAKNNWHAHGMTEIMNPQGRGAVRMH